MPSNPDCLQQSFDSEVFSGESQQQSPSQDASASPGIVVLCAPMEPAQTGRKNPISPRNRSGYSLFRMVAIMKHYATTATIEKANNNSDQYRITSWKPTLTDPLIRSCVPEPASETRGKHHPGHQQKQKNPQILLPGREPIHFPRGRLDVHVTQNDEGALPEPSEPF